MDSNDNLWDSIASMNVDPQDKSKTHASNNTTTKTNGWGIGAAALTILRGSTTTNNTNSTHGGLPISNTPPTSKSSHGGGGATNNSNTTKQKLNTKTLYSQNQSGGGGGMASALWRLGGRDENNGSNGNTKKLEDEEQSMGSFWNNLKKNHESEEDEASFNHQGGNLLHDESDYDTDKEQDKVWLPTKKREQEQRGLLGRDDDANGADAVEPDLLLPLSKVHPQQGSNQVRQTKSSSLNKADDDDDDGGSDADSDVDPRHGAEDQDSGKFGLGAFLDMGKEAALEEELKAYMNPNPDDKSIADMSLISASITPAEQQRLLLQRMDMSFGKSVTTMALDPKEAATKELRPWRQQKHLRRGSALGAMPPGTMAMLGNLAKDDDDSEDDEEEDPLYAIPAEFEGALDRHIPKGNFDDMWKDGAATVCSGDMVGDIPYGDNADDTNHKHIAKKVQDKLDVEDRTSLFPDADGEVYTVAQQKIRDDIAALIQPPTAEKPSRESGHSDSRRNTSLLRGASNVSKSSVSGDSAGRRRKSEEHRHSRRKSLPGHATDGGAAREERKSRRKSSHRPKDEDSEKGSRRSDRGEHRSTRKADSDGEGPSSDVKDSKSRRHKSSRPSRDETRKPSGEGDEGERRRRQSSRPHRNRDDDDCLIENKERRRHRSSRPRRDADGEFDDSRRRDEKERRSHRSSRQSSSKRGDEPDDDCMDKSKQERRSSRRENDNSEKGDKSRRKSSTRRNDDESDDRNLSRRSRKTSSPTLQADGEDVLSSKEAKSSRVKQVGHDVEQKKAPLAIERDAVNEEQILNSEVKPWRNPNPHASRKNSLGDTDKHENTALKRLEERSRAAAASSSLVHKPKSTVVSKASDVSRQGSASTGTGATAETAASLGPEDNDYTEPLGRPKRKSFLSSLGLKKNVHAKLEDNDEGRAGLLSDERAPRRRGSSSEPKATGPARRRGSNEKPSVLGVALRRNSIEGDNNATEKRALLSEEKRSPKGWGSIDEDDLDEPKKERRNRSTSVPKETNKDMLRGDRLRGPSVPKHQAEVVATEGDTESKKKKSNASHNRRSVEDEPSSHQTRKSTTNPSRSAGNRSPRMRKSDDIVETLDNEAAQKKDESDRRKKSRRPPSH